MVKRPTVLLLIPHLGGGGAERVTALLANGLSPRKYDLHLGLITRDDAGRDPLPPWVVVHVLGVSRVRFGATRLLRLIHKLRPAIVLSSMAHLNFLVLLLRPLFPRKTSVLIRQNGIVAPEIATRSRRSTRLLYRFLYGRADRIVCQTQAMAAEVACLPRTAGKLRVLPNPVDVVAVRASARKSPSHFDGPGPHLLAVGRLSHEKGFDMLLKAFVDVRASFPEADLTILGAGPEERALKTLRRSLALEPAVRFAGYVPRPEAWFTGAALFVLSSRHEGLPNALLEAAAGGLPIVAVPACGGVRELLDQQPGVWVAQAISASALAQSLQAALQELHPAQRFPHSWIDEFRMDRAIQRYEELFDETLARWAR